MGFVPIMAFFVFSSYIIGARVQGRSAQTMNFVEKNKVVGHLTIVKLDKRTGKEEVLYDDHNVITGGLGRSLTQIMTTQDCGEDKCNTDNPFPPKCNLYHYQTSRFQVGTGASANVGEPESESADTVSLGKPLSIPQYGNQKVRSIGLKRAALFSDENVLLDFQDFGFLRSRSVLSSSIVHVWSLDEETANGQLLDEAGLFVHNPYLKKDRDVPDESPIQPAVSIPLLNPPQEEEGEEEEEPVSGPNYEPGHVLAAYKKFEPILKENYFTLLFRWSLTFL